MKKQLAILVLSTAILSGCNLCDECRDGRCDAQTQPVVTQRLVLNRTSHFAFDSATLTAASQKDLAPIVDRLKRNPDERVQVNGYTDSTGPAEYNMVLSEKRAMAVKNYLEDEGIAADRISTKGYGASHYVASNATADGRAQNRRTEIVCHE